MIIARIVSIKNSSNKSRLRFSSISHDDVFIEIIALEQQILETLYQSLSS